MIKITETLKLKAKKDVSLIINPRAGSSHSKEYAVSITSLLSERGYNTSTYFTESQGHATQLAKELSSKSDFIVCCGGDGTLNETVCGIIESGSDIPLGYIPAGTTNDFAKTLKLSKNLTDAVNIITEENAVSLDVGFINEQKPFVYVASFGLFASVSYATAQESKNKYGHAAYIIDGIKSLSDIKTHKAKVTADGIVYEGSFIFGSVTNSLSLGGVMNFKASDVTLNDGKFELLLIKTPESIPQIGNIVVSMINQQFNAKEIIFTHASEILFEFESPTAFTSDGEYAGTYEKIKITNSKGKLRLYTKK